MLLKDIGAAIIKGIGYVAKFEGLLPASISSSAVVAKVESEIAQLGDVIVNVEAMGQALSIAGPDKLKAAAPLVAQIILKSSIMVGHSIDNQQLFTQGSAKLADGMADILNSLKK